MPIDLAPTEYKMLRYLMVNANVVLSRSQLLDAVWGTDFYGDDSVVATYISYLRRKVDCQVRPADPHPPGIRLRPARHHGANDRAPMPGSAGARCAGQAEPVRLSLRARLIALMRGRHRGRADRSRPVILLISVGRR